MRDSFIEGMHKAEDEERKREQEVLDRKADEAAAELVKFIDERAESIAAMFIGELFEDPSFNDRLLGRFSEERRDDVRKIVTAAAERVRERAAQERAEELERERGKAKS